MRPEELILGFDARDMRDHWSDDRKRKFLFRPDVRIPLSTDPIVWPSVFENSKHPKPRHVGFYMDLWEKLDDLKSYLDSLEDLSIGQYRIVAISLAINICTPVEREAWMTLLRGISPVLEQKGQVLPLPAAVPSSLDNNWLFLGYDVSDKWGLSGLSNCGFLPTFDDVESLRNQWAPYLNTFHLFNDLDKAAEFKEFSNKRVKEHAPFFVFGIWSI